MSPSEPPQLERARRLLAHEGAVGQSAEDPARAAARVYEKLDERLTPLLGAAGVRALFLRSATLARRERAMLTEAAMMESSHRLSEGLRRIDSGDAALVAEALFGSFLALLTTFIGERLTNEALRGAWPTLRETPPTESE